ncbi:enamine deaminase RidA (YjgF/YER057c/UK114 family) [Caulobacter ginsengisoli]|uniref:Enamine deaminase RidA (YjgF/YER057c/UK114 family) n=1 Tax=Caulobacter ginsengisoli TaxID=400775 RepID=A0ABU0IYV0_9CAUL|nr:RidA family protein [Caulobacter ginsengisoli]MDQ0466229.1 enamine deaminase RidA (YjgF/YER057c/UK114 family) [Caulobacter ginsengisoli]
MNWRIAEIMLERGFPLPRLTYENRFLPGRRLGSLVFISSVTPRQHDGTELVGQIGSSIGIEQAKEAARWCVANSLACLYDTLLQDIHNVAGVVDVLVFMNSVTSFTQHSEVADAASELFELTFGDAGKHSRGAIGVASLVRNVPVVLKATYSMSE